MSWGYAQPCPAQPRSPIVHFPRCSDRATFISRIGIITSLLSSYLTTRRNGHRCSQRCFQRDIWNCHKLPLLGPKGFCHGFANADVFADKDILIYIRIFILYIYTHISIYRMYTDTRLHTCCYFPQLPFLVFRASHVGEPKAWAEKSPRAGYFWPGDADLCILSA